MKQTPSLWSHNIHLALPGKGCGGSPLSAGAAKEGRNVTTGSREGLGFDSGTSFLTAKRVEMGKGLPGGMQNPISSAGGDEKWANPRRAGLNPPRPGGNKTQHHPASQTSHPEAMGRDSRCISPGDNSWYR